MNNGFQLEEPEEKPKDTSIEEARLTRMIEALARLLVSQEWAVLQELHFGRELERVERLLISESKKDLLEDREIYRLQGELKWAKRYADLREWAKALTNQLKKLKNGN